MTHSHAYCRVINIVFPQQYYLTGNITNNTTGFKNWLLGITITVSIVGLIEKHPEGEGQDAPHGGVGHGAGVAHGPVAGAAGDADLGEPVHEGLAAVGVEHPGHDADQGVLVGPAKWQIILLYSRNRLLWSVVTVTLSGGR